MTDDLDLQSLVTEQPAEPVATPIPRRDERVFTATYSATGRRKNATARVILTPGSGTITINEKPVAEYLPVESLVMMVNSPFEVTQLNNRFNVTVNAQGGGIAGQAGAVRHGIARALSLIDDATRKQLKAAGMLTRDAREKERKKYGQAGARKRFQFSKR